MSGAFLDHAGPGFVTRRVGKPASQPSSQPASRDLEKIIGALSLYVTHSLLIVLNGFEAFELQDS